MLRNSYRSFLLIATLSFLLLAMLSIALCVYVDPYRMYGTSRVTEKPFVFHQEALAKAYLIERIRPNTLVLGNAEVEAGIDPESLEWPENIRPVFNAAGQNVDVFMAWRLLQHDIAAKPPQLVVLGLDFLDFVNQQIDGKTVPIRENELRLLVDRNGSPNGSRGMQLWRDFFNTTLTRQAIWDSIGTLRLRKRPALATVTEMGFNPARDYQMLLHSQGAEAIFLRNDQVYRAQYRELYPSLFYSPSRNLQFNSLAAIIRLAEQNDIRLVLFVPPYHSRYLEILHDTGFWVSFEAWKRALVRTIENAAGKRRGVVQLYDFSGYDDISGEQVPQPGDRQAEMRWYRDSIHYTKDLGDLMIASMMGAGPVLGQELNANTIDADLKRIRNDREHLFAPSEARR
ncbi:MAG TPA: hypothetical protein VG891_02445 [Rhizomicrobium sp.]|nr:hypothetical protein [Rhizomicrobium sp.]